MIAYKQLKPNGEAPYRVGFMYPVPEGDGPSEWMDLGRAPYAGSCGFHVHEEMPYPRFDCVLWEAETDGRHSRNSGILGTAVERIRLLRRVPLPEGEFVEHGLRLCTKCGKPHDLLKYGRALSWADPKDGHSYYGESWESMARRLLAEKAGE